MTLKRREFLKSGAMTAVGTAFLTSRLAFANTGRDSSQARFVFIILRGALDGIAAVPPYGDPDYAALRRELALKAPGTAGGALPLNGHFGLHPSFGFLQESYTARELIVFHAVATPYRERSHFDGQDVLENGVLVPHASQTGWLNRALADMQPNTRSRELGVALGQNIPLVMRGPAAVTSWSPSRLASLDDDTLQRITDLYASDPVLAGRLADALAANSIADTPAATVQATAVPTADPAMETDMTAAPASGQSLTQRARPVRYTEVVRATAGFLRRDDGPRVAVFDTTGWDTHANEGSAEGQLATRLAALDAGLRTLRTELGPTWANTVVLLATEFGRTAATNGTRGTDHGTGSAAFLLGGAVAGGRVVADWPGLSARALYQGRDLQATTDMRSIMKGVLSEHLQVSNRTLEGGVFPDSAGSRPLRDLLKS